MSCQVDYLNLEVLNLHAGVLRWCVVVAIATTVKMIAHFEFQRSDVGVDLCGPCLLMLIIKFNNHFTIWLAYFLLLSRR